MGSREHDPLCFDKAGHPHDNECECWCHDDELQDRQAVIARITERISPLSRHQLRAVEMAVHEIADGPR